MIITIEIIYILSVVFIFLDRRRTSILIEEEDSIIDPIFMYYLILFIPIINTVYTCAVILDDIGNTIEYIKNRKN